MTIINKDRETPCVWSIYRRFGSLSAVYELIGYSAKRDNQGIAERRKDASRRREPRLSERGYSTPLCPASLRKPSRCAPSGPPALDGLTPPTAQSLRNMQLMTGQGRLG